MPVIATPRHVRESTLGLRFLVLTVLVGLTAAAIAVALVSVSSRLPVGRGLTFPLPFWPSTACLGVGSLVLQRGLGFVRRERQRAFRAALVQALVVGTLFAGLQVCGLWRLAQQQVPADASTGAAAFLFLMIALHGMHFTVALLFLNFVTLRAFADWYDHEYYWGVTVCTYFWHALAVVWCGILFVFAIGVLTSANSWRSWTA